MKRIAALFIVLLALAAQAASAFAAQDRPNIVWLTSEDNSYHWIGCYGNKSAKTPNIDKLAATGIRYTHAYSNGSVCAVARNTLILGRYAPSMGTQNMRSRYPIPPQFKTYVSYLREAGYYCTNHSKTDYNFKGDDKSYWDECSPRAHWRNRKEGQPFFAVFNTTTSHESSLFAKKTESFRKAGKIPATPSRDPKSFTLPPFLPDTPEIRQDWVTYMDIITAMDAEIGAWLKELEDDGVRENTIVFYYSDHGGIVPRHKRYINDTGTHVPLVVNFPKKWRHLAPADAGTVSDRVVAFIDLPPTLLSLAGVKVPDAFHGRAIAGKGARDPEPYAFLYGQRFDSRMLRNVRAVTDGRYRYIRNFHPHRHRGIFAGYPHGQIGWNSFLKTRQEGQTTTEQNAFWESRQPVEEFYDIANDPWEVNNLANDPEFAKRRDKMRSALLNKMREIGDTGIVPESMYEEISKDSTVYDYVHNQEFPYSEVLNAALTAGDGGPGILKKLRAAMNSKNPVIRYWGATGCTINAKDAGKAKGQLKKLLSDEEPSVRLAAAEALHVLGDKQTGFNAILDILKTTDDPIVSLEALNRTQALEVMKDVPEDVWARACKVGSYSKRMVDDQTEFPFRTK